MPVLFAACPHSTVHTPQSATVYWLQYRNMTSGGQGSVVIFFNRFAPISLVILKTKWSVKPRIKWLLGHHRSDRFDMNNMSLTPRRMHYWIIWALYSGTSNISIHCTDVLRYETICEYLTCTLDKWQTKSLVKFTRSKLQVNANKWSSTPHR